MAMKPAAAAKAASMVLETKHTFKDGAGFTWTPKTKDISVDENGCPVVLIYGSDRIFARQVAGPTLADGRKREIGNSQYTLSNHEGWQALVAMRNSLHIESFEGIATSSESPASKV